MFRIISRTVTLTAILTLFFCSSGSAAPRDLPEGKLPDDVRLQPLKDLDGYFPFTPPASKAAWEKRAERVRRQILVSQGLWPMPTKTPLNAVIHGRIDRDEYTVEKVYFESAPGFFVTGNLYRPKGRPGKVPGILFAHGHWSNARLSEASEEELRREIADGEERFERGGRSRFQSMCVQLARMGCVVWQWDMLGNSDALQISAQLTHGFAKQRPEMNTIERWGLYSPQAESHAQSIMGLQTWNSIRSLDFVSSLPDVDTNRLAITGASGGGTQTMLLAAVDPRVDLAFPAVMVSTAMQGGCTCENASLLRVDTGNIEFAALFAPKPQGMTTANDWTKEMSTKGFPDLKQLYTLVGAPGNVMLKRGEHFPHNYNAVSRSAFYTWLNHHFKLGEKAPVIERDYEPLKKEQLTVWDESHPAPKESGPDFERNLLEYFVKDTRKQLESASTDENRKLCAAALEVVLGERPNEPGDIEWEPLTRDTSELWAQSRGLIRNKRYKEELPAIMCAPSQGNGQVVLWLDKAGKTALYDQGGGLRPEIARLIQNGTMVIGVDLLYQGEFLADGKPLKRTQRVKNPREAAAYTFGYNYSVFVHRVHDVLTAVTFARSRPGTKHVAVVGLEGAGHWVAAARTQRESGIDQAIMDTGAFRFGKVMDIHDPDFVPGGAKYGDLPGMVALGAPGAAWISGETDETLALAKAQYQSAQAGAQLTIYKGNPDQARTAALQWLSQINPGSTASK